MTSHNNKSEKLRTLWLHPELPNTIQVIDQRKLPHEFTPVDLSNVQEVVHAIKDMIVRGAPLIGATAAYGIYFACLEAPQQSDPQAYFEKALQDLANSRPTAVNLFWAINRQSKALAAISDWQEKARVALQTAQDIVEEDVEICRKIGENGLGILEELYAQNPDKPVQILTHCNAGMLGCIEWGTATSPIYQAHQKGIPVHVWVDETRPRNQGAKLTAWELEQAGVPYTVVVDNVGGHLMQHGMVDMVIVGTDRTTRSGDVANKIGTYLKALAAKDNAVPFYVALPSTTIDWEISDGLKEIPIEQRSPEEVKYMTRWTGEALQKVLITPQNSEAANYGFDVTPARLVTALITERGVCAATESGILAIFPEKKKETWV